jgi:hypothetical protein
LIPGSTYVVPADSRLISTGVLRMVLLRFMRFCRRYQFARVSASMVQIISKKECWRQRACKQYSRHKVVRFKILLAGI